MEKKKINLDKEKKVVGEFKEFISKGNIVDMAVGVIIGSAFGKIVSSLVNDIFMPLIGIIIGGLDFSKLTLTVGEAVIAYGTFIQNIVDFLIIALCIFMIIKVLAKFKKKEEVKPELVKESEEVVLKIR